MVREILAKTRAEYFLRSDEPGLLEWALLIGFVALAMGLMVKPNADEVAVAGWYRVALLLLGVFILTAVVRPKLCNIYGELYGPFSRAVMAVFTAFANRAKLNIDTATFLTDSLLVESVMVTVGISLLAARV